MLQNAQIQEVNSILHANKKGLDFGTLFSKCTMVVEERELALALKSLKENGQTYREDDIYYASDIDRRKADDTDNLPEPVDKYPIKLIGTMLRGGAAGAVALLFYRKRKLAPLSKAEVQEVMADVPDKKLSEMLRRLVHIGYIECVEGHLCDGVYRWSGKYCYPFRICRTTDTRLLKAHHLH